MALPAMGGSLFQGVRPWIAPWLRVGAEACVFRACRPYVCVLMMSFQSVFSGGLCLWKVTCGGLCSLLRKVSACRSPAVS